MRSLPRRQFLTTATLSAGAAMAAGRVALSEEDAPPSLQSFDKVAAQQFPWGWIRWLMNAELDPAAEMTLGIVHVEPNQSNPAHIHPNSAEYLHVLAGSCEHRVGGQWVALRTGDTLRIPKGVVHQARAKDQSCRALIVYDTGKRQMVPVKE
jgi:quercetin dioxygenase-like cupin family protein